jgi:UDPglucose 6-dehydrogenase
MKIGFIGQGFIGRNMADDFLERGFSIVRYSLDAEYVGNKEEISQCDVVFIAVPTPTKTTGFDMTVLRTVLPTVPKGKIAVIKSTILPGSTALLQIEFPDIIILHSPEFLREKSAAFDTRNPVRNIIGMAVNDEVHNKAAESVLEILPLSKFSQICLATESEIVKYAGNCFLMMKVIYMNLIYEAALASNADYNMIAEMVGADARIGRGHTQVIDKSGHEGSVPGRGAGGHCFPKDLAAFTQWYQEINNNDSTGIDLLKSLENKNNSLLRQSGKDLDLLNEIYGQ